ncbi:MAG: metallophosphoesterase [Victivallaceae bacterium]|nr:metallophosphoesterase [Victivallaceae bacterium]
MKKLRFAVLGDMHFCLNRTRGRDNWKYYLPNLPDYIRYSEMTEQILKPMFKIIRTRKPDFVISVGDFVEGEMPDDKEKTYAEMKQAWAFMETLGCPCLIAKGTHEGSGKHNPVGAQAYRDIVLPGISKAAGIALKKEFFRYDHDETAFFFLDYLGFNAEQEMWFEKGLKDAVDHGKRIFVAAHPPLYAWGRHFFSDSRFIGRIIKLFEKYPVDAYLCGHTHNQAVSFHETRKNNGGFLQIMASSVGYKDAGIIALDEIHALARFSGKDNLLWGIGEDSSPGFYLIEIDHNKMDVEWNSCRGDKASASLKNRRSRPENVIPPEYKPFKHSLTLTDAGIIKAAAFNVFGMYSNYNETMVSFNGIEIGPLPPNVSYASRCCIPLNKNALETICLKNKIQIKLPPAGEFVVGSFSLEILLWNNKILHSKVAREIFTCGAKWKAFPAPRRTMAALPGAEVSICICFDSHKTQNDLFDQHSEAEFSKITDRRR